MGYMGAYSGVGACLGHYGTWYVVRSSYGFIAIVVASEGLELL